MAGGLARRARSWLQELWAQRAIDALAEAGAFAEAGTREIRNGLPATRVRRRGEGTALRARLAAATDGDALAEARDALGDVLAMATARDVHGDDVAGVLDRARHPLLLTDGARCCLDANPAAQGLLGASRTEIRVHRLDDFVPPRFRGTLDDRWNESRRGPTRSGSVRVLAADGREVGLGWTAVELVPDIHLIVVERIDGVRFGPWAASVATQRAAPLLRPREREVLALVSAGRTSAGIALQLELSRNTVESHIRNAVVRLGASNRTHAVVVALGRGEISLPAATRPAGEDA